MGVLLSNLRRLLTMPASHARLPANIPGPTPVGPTTGDNIAAIIVPSPQPSAYKTPFARSFEPFKAERKRITEWEDATGVLQWKDNYPYGYGLERDADGDITGQFKEVFRSPVEVGWAETFDRLGLQWEYEPMKFDMGPEYFSYTPDFKVAGLSIPDSNRSLYIETKWFGEYMDLTKYICFTEWYDCDLLILAHDKGGVLRPRNKKHFLILKCANCGNYDWYPCDEMPTDDYIRRQNDPSSRYVRRQNFPYVLARKFPHGYRMAADGTFWLIGEQEPPPLTILTESYWSEKQQREYWAEKIQSWRSSANSMPFKRHPPACLEKPLERIAVPNYFLIEAGAIRQGLVLMPEDASSGGLIRCIDV